MKLLPSILMAGLLLAMSCSLLAFQGRVFEEDEPSHLPPNANEKAEWAFARLHYTMGNEFGGGYRGFQRWAADYPKADRHFVMGVRRPTRLHAPPFEQVGDAYRNEMSHWPCIYVVNPAQWSISPTPPSP